MKLFQKIAKGVLYALLCGVALTGCGKYGEVDGLILTDNQTGKKYIIEHNVGINYIIKGEVIKISGTDTVIVFERK